MDEVFPVFIPDSNMVLNRLSNDVSFIFLSNLEGGQKTQNNFSESEVYGITCPGVYGHRYVVVEILFQMKGSQHSVCHEKQCHYTGLT